MNFWKALSCLVVAGALTCPIVLAQEDAPAPKTGKPAATVTKEPKEPKKPKETDEAPKPRMLVPAEKIPSLTEEQKQKLIAIAAQAEKDKEAVMQKAREASFAILTDAQKEEIEASKRKAQEAAAARKAEREKKKEARLKARAEKQKLKAKPADGAEPAPGATTEPPKQ